MKDYALLLNRAVELLRLTRQTHQLTLSEIQFLDHEIDGILVQMDPDSYWDSRAALEEFKKQAAE